MLTITNITVLNTPKLDAIQTSKSSHKYCFFIGNIPFKITGIESAVFKRYQLFVNHLNIIPTIITFRYNLYIPKAIARFQKEGKLPKQANFVNLYDIFQTTGQPLLHLRQQPLNASEMPSNHRKTVWQEQQKAAVHYYNAETRLLSHTHYLNDKEEIWQIKHYNHKGYLSRVVYFDTEPRQRLFSFFYRDDGSLAIQKIFAQEDALNVLKQIVVYDCRNQIQQVFTTEEALHTYMLTHYLNQHDQDETVVIVADRKPQQALAVDKTKIMPQLKIIPVVHSVHVSISRNLNSPIRSANDYLYDLPNLDGLVVLTQAQKQDIIERFGDYHNVYCLPHTVSDPPIAVPFNSRKPFKAVAVGRLAPEKGHEAMIRLFAKVVERLPEATLDIYGHGALKDKLNQLIDVLEMSDNIRIHDFSHNVYEKFSAARVSLLTSTFEGFALVVLESLASGCPVVAHDIRYGPSEMIETDYNGVLVNKTDDDAFIQAVVDVLSIDTLNKDLSYNAYESTDRFSEKKVAKKWRAFIQNIEDSSSTT